MLAATLTTEKVSAAISAGRPGVWLRPFAKLIYTMPPYVIEARDLSRITRAICEVAAGL